MSAREKLKESVDKAAEPPPNDIAPEFSEEHLALEWARRHGDGSRYVAAWNKWLLWDGKRWDFDRKREAFTLSRNLCREFSRAVNKLKDRQRVASAKTRAAVVSLSGEDRKIAAVVEQWDADLWSLNTPDGAIDLRTGIIRPHRAEDYMTKITAVAPDAKCPTPIWTKFLSEVTAKNKELEEFLQRVVGYSLTGVTKEHALFFLYGEGRNGKGVFMNTVAGIVNDYHCVTTMEMFIETKNERHLTEVARLMGARMVLASETPKNRFWNESRIKQFTGGDKLAANFMRQDHFEFTPQFKLIFAGNHKPRLKSVDVAIQSRLHLIPFLVTIPEKDRDKDLPEKLKAEWPGILAWMVEGCVEWQKNGLAPPKIVTEATDEYLKSEDDILIWFEESCIVDPQGALKFSELYRSWKDYAEVNGVYTGSSKSFSEKLQTIDGLVKEKVEQERGFKGVRFRTASDGDEAPRTKD